MTEESLRLVGKAGVKATEIFFNANCELEKSFVSILKDIKNEYGTSVLAVHPTMSLAESFMLFSAYERRYEEGLDQYKRYAEIAAELGAKYIIMHGGKPNRVLDDHGYFERFAGIAEAVRRNGAVLLQENVVNFRAGDLSVLSDMKEYLGKDAAFCIDIKQCVRGGYSPFEAIKLLGGCVKHLHLSDNSPENDCMLPLRGSFDFERFFGACKAAGYAGNAVVEVYRDAYGEYAELFASYNDFIKSLNF